MHATRQKSNDGNLGKATMALDKQNHDEPDYENDETAMRTEPCRASGQAHGRKGRPQMMDWVDA
jgi:hypothetical protein